MLRRINMGNIVAGERGTYGKVTRIPESDVSPAKSSSTSEQSKRKSGATGGVSVPHKRAGVLKLGAKAAQGARRIFGVKAGGSKEEEVIVITETLTHQRTPRLQPTANAKTPSTQKTPTASTMTIEKIQIALGKAIEGRRVSRIVDMIGNNFESVDNAVNLKDAVTVKLLKKAIDLTSQDDGSTIFHLIAHKEDKVKILELFLELDGVKVIGIIDTVKNGKGKTAHQIAEDKNNKKFLEVVRNAIQSRLENAIKRKDVHSIIDIIIKHYPIISQTINTGDIGIMELIIRAAQVKATELEEVEEREEVEGVELEEIEGPELIIDKKQEKLVLQEEAQSALDKLIKKNRLYKFDLKRQRSFFTLTYFEKKDGMYNGQQDGSAQSCPNLLLLDGVSSVEESDKGGKTPLDVVEESGKKKFVSIVRNKPLKESMQELKECLGKFDSIVEGLRKESDAQAQTEPKTPPQAPTRPNVLSEDFHEPEGVSDDSGVGSPGSSYEAQDFVLGAEGGLRSLTKSRRSSLSSSIESLNSILSDVEKISDAQTEEEIKPKLQEEFPPAAKPLPLLNKGKPKGPSGRRAFSKRLRNHEDRTQEGEPTPVVTPARDAAKAPDQVTKEPQVIIPEEKKKKENILPTKQKPANNRNFYIALTVICSVGTIVSLAAAGIYSISAQKANPVFSTSSILAIGALCFIGIGLATAAKITWNSIPPSELSSTDLTSHKAPKELGLD